MRQRTVFEVGIDLLDDRMTSAGCVSGDGIKGAGGEERVEPMGIEQSRLLSVFRVQLGDPTDNQTPRDLLALLL